MFNLQNQIDGEVDSIQLSQVACTSTRRHNNIPFVGPALSHVVEPCGTVSQQPMGPIPPWDPRWTSRKTVGAEEGGGEQCSQLGHRRGKGTPTQHLGGAFVEHS